MVRHDRSPAWRTRVFTCIGAICGCQVAQFALPLLRPYVSGAAETTTSQAIDTTTNGSLKDLRPETLGERAGKQQASVAATTTATANSSARLALQAFGSMAWQETLRHPHAPNPATLSIKATLLCMNTTYKLS